MIRIRATAPCTSAADDLAYGALADAVRATADLDDVRVIGGHMVGLLLTAFPVPGLEVRRTADADAGVSTEVAARDVVHARLLDRGYATAGGNRLVSGGKTIDLIVETPYPTARPRTLGTRQFDSTLGLDLALALPPIVIDTTVVHRDGRTEQLVVREPTVEAATILKSAAAMSRHSAKDLIDLYHLLAIRHEHGAESIGGWRLDEEPARGHRLDAVRVLRSIGVRDSRFVAAGVRPTDFVALVREYVAQDDPDAPGA
ncbi:hypothetical protein DEI81_10385 [Curtobacterium sp. MCBD17_013]|uniref:hypothetical protein n=1 Tax=unclassified Curtobacterium TaxID=257496 RepID=UPI000DA7F3D9|nr:MULTISPECIES: hypothetical protein [unclassified Curtobacterium]PZF61798.1 hypothetical protein DEI81_10385 [Curtobacterium sp. MCBD17_013]WIB63363.1 hypothetical protein DEI94_14630 [Curtobacterium sp. MCBD17_040]